MVQNYDKKKKTNTIIDIKNWSDIKYKNKKMCLQVMKIIEFWDKNNKIPDN